MTEHVVAVESVPRSRGHVYAAYCETCGWTAHTRFTLAVAEGDGADHVEHVAALREGRAFVPQHRRSQR